MLDPSARQKFNVHRGTAKVRSIAWEFTFEEWCKVWEDSGKWLLRGRRKGCYCMARIGDVGPYRAGNVEIITAAQNTRDSYRHCTVAERRAKQWQHFFSQVGPVDWSKEPIAPAPEQRVA